MSSLSFIPLVEQLSTRVIRILGCNPGVKTLQGTNTYLIGTGKKRILIDSSGGSTISDYVESLSNELKKQSCTLQEILITHWHPDHTEGVQPIMKSILSEPIRVSKYRLTEQPEWDLVTKYNYIDDGFEFVTEGATLKAVFTPGHSKDHLTFYLKEENALFSGDCILGETTANFEDLFDYLNSLEKILHLGPAIIYPGHGPVVKDGVSQIKYYIDHRKKRNEQIIEELNASNKPLNELELVKQIYLGLDEKLIPAACINVLNHLDALEKLKRVEKVEHSKWRIKKNE